MSQEEQFINGELLRLRRETQGWALSDMATRACMSVKQIRQLEEGGISSFYSSAVKITSAKKVGALLGLTTDEVLNPPQLEQPQQLDEAQTETHVVESQEPHQVGPASSVEVIDQPVQVETTPSIASAHSLAPVADVPKSKTSFWVIAALFMTALAVAAYMQPQVEPVAEPAPPLQVVPSDAADAASAAEPSSEAASSVAVSVAPTGPKATASVAAAVASSGMHAASPASALVIAPASGAASKAP